jgi:serine/threonine-protein kinase RsbW
VRAECEVRADLENLARVRALVEDACRRASGEASMCADLKLAVDEAITNVIQHGYGGGPPGAIRLSLREEDGTVTVVVEDNGRSYDPRRIAAPDLTAPYEERSLGGLGWHLIRCSVDEVRYERVNGGTNRLTLVKRVRRSGTAS